MEKKKRELGHELLARLGKKRLRPGGKETTDWLLNTVEIGNSCKILEVACNMGTTTVEIAKKYDCEIVGLDKNKEALEKAKENIAKEKLDNKVKLVEGDATKLPFEDGEFDIVINEAMLTMLNNNDKLKALKEYNRVLKSGGVLLTQDIQIIKEAPEKLEKLKTVINVPAQPLEIEKWKNLIEEAGFSVEDSKSGEMSFLTKEKLIKDEGEETAEKILETAKNDSNYEQFKEMQQFFEESKDIINYIAFKSVKRN